MRKSKKREHVLEFVDTIMESTVAAHEKLCDEGKCTLEDPCPYCRVNEMMMTEAAKIK
jgi:hypothetical protein